jgi:hypothetical protein
MSLSSARFNQPVPERARGALGSTRCGTTADGRAQARIDDGVEDIDHQIDGDENQRHHQQVGRHDRDIDILHRLHEQQSHTRPLEDGFGDDGKCNYRAKLQPCHSDDGNQRVLERVAEMDRPCGQAAGAGEADIIGAEHFEHFSAHQPHDQGHLEQAERDRGQDQRLEAGKREQPGGPPADPHHVAAPERRQPAQRHREQIDQENADQERRQRDSDQRHRLEDPGENRVAPQRRIDPHQDAEHHGEHRGASGEFQRRRHSLHQQVRNRLAKLIGHPELELRGIGEVAGELHRHGIVEAERFAHRLAFSGRRIQ